MQQEHETTHRQPWIFEIPEWNFPKLVEKFDKMTRRARKCKLKPPHFDILHEADQEVTVRTDTRYVPDNDYDEWGAQPRMGKSLVLADVPRKKIVHYYYVAISGDRPTIAGWDFIATVDHTEQDGDGIGNVIKSVPGVTMVPVEYRSAQPVCQHCNTARRRLETFILRHQSSGLTKQVGRNCLADFFSGDSPEDIATLLQWWQEAAELAMGSEEEDFFGGGGRGYARYTIEHLLTVTQAVIETCGWLSRTKAREDPYGGAKPTADIVDFMLNPPRRETDEETKLRGKVKATLSAREANYPPMVEAALEWVRGLSPTESEDYLYNLWVICRGETVRQDRLGLACSLMPAHRRFLDGERRKTEAAAREPSDYVGTVKQQGLFQNCLCKFVGEPYDNSFGGTTRRILFLKDGKDVMLWYGSGSAARDFTVGEAYDLVGTPQRHEERENRFTKLMERQTVLNRVSLATDRHYKKFKVAKPATT